MKNVVKNDAEQDAGATVAAGDTTAPKKRRKKRAEVPKRKGQIISAPREKPDTPVSTRLTKDEHQALKLCAAVLGKRSKSHAIRMAIQQFVARNGQVQVPLSLGVVDDIYPATIHHDVVELTNQLRGLEFLLLSVADQLPPSSATNQLKLMLDDASKTLERISGCVQRKR